MRGPKTFEILAQEGLLEAVSDLDQFFVWDQSETTFAKTKAVQASVLAAYIGANVNNITIAQVAGLTAALAGKQPINDELTALSSPAGTGLVIRTGTAAYTERKLVAPAAGLSISNPDLVSGDATFALANDLAALEGLASTGLAVRTAADTWAQRTLTGTASEITVTNGDGVSGNPVLSLPSSLTFTGKTVTGGTFTGISISGSSGWTGNKIGLAYGGTNSDLSATGGTSQVLKQTSAGGAVTVGQLAASDLSNGTTGTGGVALATSPTLVTPNIGAATATTVNKVTLTAPASGSTLTIANGKTLTASNSLTLTGTDGSSVAFGAGGTVAYTANNLSAFASTTSLQLAGVISDETGSGSLVFATSPSLTTPNLGTPSAVTLTNATGLPVASGISGLGTGVATFLATPSSANLAAALTDETGSGAAVFGTSPTIGAPVISGGSHTALTSLGIRSSGTGAFDLTIANSENLTAGRTLTIALGDAARTLTIGASASVSGSNTGDQTITLTGDVTGSGTGSFAASIGASKVTNTHLANSVITGQTTNNSPDTSNDYILYYSAADSTLRKATVGSISAAGATGVSTWNGRSGTVLPVAGDYDGLAFGQTGLVVKGASSNALTIKPNETLSAGRTLNVIVNDASRTLSLAGDLTTAAAFTTSGANALTLTTTGATNVTLPTSGTLATTDASSLTSGTLPSGRLGFAAASDVQAGTNTTKPIHASAAAGSNAFQTLTDGATINWDMSAGFNAKVTLGGARTLATPTNPIEGMTYALQVIQDGTGSRTLTLPASTIFDFGGAGAPTLSTGTGKIDMLYLICLNTSTPLFKASFVKGS